MQMLTRREWGLLLGASLLHGQAAEFTCPMDPDVRAKAPGRCPRCGMKLVAHTPDFREYPVRFTFTPPTIPAGVPVQVRIDVPGVAGFEVMHEKQLHLFVVSADLQYFAHEHPVAEGAGFSHKTVLPREGVYKVIADFYPRGGVPQLGETLVSTAGYRGSLAEATRVLKPDVGPQRGANLGVALRMERAYPGRKSLLFFDLSPADGLEQYLGAWAHMLMVSEDLVDTVHDHPSIADGGKTVQFDVFFARATRYRVWVQFQRSGVVNTVAFTVPVEAL